MKIAYIFIILTVITLAIVGYFTFTTNEPVTIAETKAEITTEVIQTIAYPTIKDTLTKFYEDNQ